MPTTPSTSWPSGPTTTRSGSTASRTAIETRIANGELIRADTLEDLADQLGIPADTFTKTIERYNTMYTTGVDRDFDVPKNYLSQVKTAPFYAYAARVPRCHRICSACM